MAPHCSGLVHLSPMRKSNRPSVSGIQPTASKATAPNSPIRVHFNPKRSILMTASISCHWSALAHSSIRQNSFAEIN
jgi:hypothetical protein